MLRENYSVICCSNGCDAWDMIKENTPHLFITDIVMPFCSGLELTSRIKSGHLQHTSVIILSSLTQENVIIEAFNMGADDFIAKPFSLAELSIRVKRLIRLKNFEHSFIARYYWKAIIYKLIRPNLLPFVLLNRSSFLWSTTVYHKQ